MRAAIVVAVNPFTPDFGRRPARLVGIESMLDGMGRSLMTGPADPGFTRVVLGPRGSGKTTALAEMCEAAASVGSLVLSTDAATGGLLERIPSCVAQAREAGELPRAEAHGRRLTGVTVGPLGLSWEDLPEPRPQWSLQRQLEALASWAARHGSSVLLAVDEMHAGDRGELRRLASDLQSITKVKELPLAFVGAGLSEMAYTVLQDRKMTFFHRCFRDRMSRLGFDEVWRGLRLTVADAGGTVDADALTLMTEACWSGLPYHLQSIGHHAWELAGAPSRPIDAAVAATAAARAERDLSEKVVVPMWHDLVDADQDYLAGLAHFGGEARRAAIADRVRSEASGRSLARCEDRLKASGHVVETGGGTLRMVGPLSASAVNAITAREAEYGRPAAAVPAPSVSATSACNAWMPRVKAKCVLPRGHKGGHRSRI